MSNLQQPTTSYPQDFAEVLGQIQQTRQRALLCRDKDDEVVEYALSRNLSPALVAQYQLQLPDKQLIAAKLHELLMQHEGVGDE